MPGQIYAVCPKCLFSLVLLVSIGLPALGQSASSAAVNGIVQDTTDARIPNASVKLINTDTGTESKSTTTKDGNFTIPSVLPGHYRLQIEREGFDTTQLTAITLNVGDNKSVIIRMKVGSSQQTVTVDASGLNVNTTDASVSTVVDRQFVANMPLNGRSFQDLISMTPGVVTQSPQARESEFGGGGDFSVNGQRTESNYYTVDGVSANTLAGVGTGAPGPGTSGNLGSSTALGTTQSLLSVDSLQELRVQSSTYSAEFGRSPGGQFSLVSKSGTNELHGMAFDYLRNDVFDANNWFNDFYKVSQSPLRQNDFGGTLGGPIIIPHFYDGTSRAFFFFSYEGLRLDQPTAATIQYVPSASARSTAAPPLQGIMNAFPLPTPGAEDFGDGLAEFIKSYSLPSNINATSFRVDQQITSKNNLFFRFSDTPTSEGGRVLSSAGEGSTSSHTYTVGVTSQFSSHSFNEARLGYSRTSVGQTYSLDSFGGAQPLNLSQAFGTGDYPTAEPYVAIYTANGIGTIFTENTHNSSRSWNITDSISTEIGQHHIKLGIDYRTISSPLAPADVLAENIYESLHAIQVNAADIGEVIVSSPGEPIYNQLSTFIQDEWRVSRKLSLSSGIRWDVNPPPTDANGQGPYTVEGSISEPQSLTLAPRGTPLWKTSWYNFAPRLGVAFIANPKAGYETVWRTGAGVFFDTGNNNASLGYSGIGTGAVAGYSEVALPYIPSQLGLTPSIIPPYTSASVYAFAPHLQLPYTLEWNVTLEQGMGKAQTVTLSYVGANGRRLLEQEQLSLHAINPDFGNVFFTVNGLTSNYQALQAKFQRVISHGLQALGSYTWAHSIDYGSVNTALPYLRGDSDFDVRHQFTGGLSWNIPNRGRNTLINALVRAWGFDGHFEARTAFPVNLLGNMFFNPATGAGYYGGVDFNPGVQVYLHGPLYPGGRRLNPEAFTPVTIANENGDVPRNFFRGFDCVQLNTALRRTFNLHERVNLQVRAEAFNVLNHPIFGYVNPTLTSSTFGEPTQTLNESLGTVSPLYQQGGPRSLQFALKLAF